MYLKVKCKENQQKYFNKNRKCNRNIFGHPGKSTKIYFFSWKEFNPLYIPKYVRLEYTEAKIKMVDFYCYGFREDVVLYNIIEKKKVKLSTLKNMLELDKIYWIEKCSKRKAHIIVTEKCLMTDNKRLMPT